MNEQLETTLEKRTAKIATYPKLPLYVALGCISFVILVIVFA